MHFSRLAFSLVLMLAPFTTEAALFDSDCPPPAVGGTGASFETAFSTDGHLSEMVIKEIQSAKHSIKVAAHRFVSKETSIELLNAERGGKDVQILLDKNRNKDGYSDATFFINMSQPPHELKGYDNQYQDYMVIDDKDLIIGNISSVGEQDAEPKNAASALIIHNAPELTKKYNENWQKLWKSSEVMTNPNLITVKPKKK
jgi:phosphatidylserine/phosphatidylglycerophosphate/cardiolipin synthase-like enzyme